MAFADTLVQLNLDGVQQPKDVKCLAQATDKPTSAGVLPWLATERQRAVIF